MMVLVETPVWSLALRRQPRHLNPEQQRLNHSLRELIQEGRAELIGPVRQELLSGIREQSQFRHLRDQLRAFPDVALSLEDYEEAALMSNRCRASGIAESNVDMLICAIAARRNWSVFTVDRDFIRYAELLGMRLHHGSEI
ncbi:MAG TPA: PIN domain-containing protein [Terriglobales bacterium]|nr:PIN domain-containing protein [Terriglobales bacterium]